VIEKIVTSLFLVWTASFLGLMAADFALNGPPTASEAARLRAELDAIPPVPGATLLRTNSGGKPRMPSASVHYTAIGSESEIVNHYDALLAERGWRQHACSGGYCWQRDTECASLFIESRAASYDLSLRSADGCAAPLLQPPTPRGVVIGASVLIALAAAGVTAYRYRRFESLLRDLVHPHRGPTATELFSHQPYPTVEAARKRTLASELVLVLAIWPPLIAIASDVLAPIAQRVLG
jgi:hypothetical protein